MSVADRWRSIRDRVGEAADRAGRDPADVVVVAAAKTFPAEAVLEAVAAGVGDVGENYVQEAAGKHEIVGDAVRWHLIGRLQRNKAARAVAIFDWIHSVDSATLLDALDAAGTRAGRPVRALVQVNLAGEATKGGVAPEALEALCEAAAARRGLTIDGLMTVPPPVARAEESRPYFARMRELRERVARLRLPGVQPKELSMGMSADFEVAVEEGATLVRIGTALFGPREQRR